MIFYVKLTSKGESIFKLLLCKKIRSNNGNLTGFFLKSSRFSVHSSSLFAPNQMLLVQILSLNLLDADKSPQLLHKNIDFSHS
jgi:hypothetical protein